jgi:phospholipase/lecithinase/hemolysin
LPFQRTAAGGIERKIVVEYNEAVELYNTKLSKGLASFNQNYPNSRIVYIDVYNPLLDIIVNSNKYGNSNFYTTTTISRVMMWSLFLNKTIIDHKLFQIII